jgi:acetyltransferase-like isoleucine patch superfamily enzyme
MAAAVDSPGELRRSFAAGRLAPVLARGGGRAERAAVALALRLEGGPFRSATARDLLRERRGVAVGAWSYGACLRPGQLPPGVTVGRYVSMATQVSAFRRDHPVERLSMHPLFYNHAVGPLEVDAVDAAPLEVGHDAWLGHQCTILSGCTRIGIGAVVGAGAVVTRDVPDLAVVTGNPARVRRLRFADDVCEAVLGSRWWERTAEELLAELPSMLEPVADRWAQHPLLAARSRAA